MIQANAIDHICLAVSSLRQSQAYYERVFGVVCKFRENDPKTLVVETPRLHFFLSQSDESPAFLSQQHLSFRVDSLEKAIASLHNLGITNYETGAVDFFEHSNYRWCEWRDPDGIRLECVELLS